MSSSYLENYLDSISCLPGDMYKTLTLMRELDDQVEDMTSIVDKKCAEYVANSKKLKKDQDSEEQETLLADIRELQQKCVRLADEKVELAVQSYELVDKHIRRLDDSLTKFEGELKAVNPTLAPTINSQFAESEGDRNSNQASKRRKTEDAGDANSATVSNPNEPLYCFCKRPSYGAMVMCENQACDVEWFHFDCVGLSGPPKGKWFCDACRKKLGR